MTPRRRGSKPASDVSSRIEVPTGSDDPNASPERRNGTPGCFANRAAARLLRWDLCVAGLHQAVVLSVPCPSTSQTSRVAWGREGRCGFVPRGGCRCGWSALPDAWVDIPVRAAPLVTPVFEVLRRADGVRLLVSQVLWCLRADLVEGACREGARLRVALAWIAMTRRASSSIAMKSAISVQGSSQIIRLMPWKWLAICVPAASRSMKAEERVLGPAGCGRGVSGALLGCSLGEEGYGFEYAQQIEPF